MNGSLPPHNPGTAEESFIITELFEECWQVPPGCVFDSNPYPILDPRKYNHKGTFTIGVMINIWTMFTTAQAMESFQKPY